MTSQTQRQERRVAAALNHEELRNECEDEDKYSMEGEVLARRRVSCKVIDFPMPFIDRSSKYIQSD